MPLYSACPTDAELPSEGQHDIVQVIRDNGISDIEIAALRETNYRRPAQQEKALLEILSDAQEMTTKKLVAFAKLAPALVAPLIAEIEDSEKQCKLVDDLIGYWVEADLATSIDVIKDLHATTLDDLLLRRSVKLLARVHPVEAFRFSHEYFGRFGYVLESIAFETMAEQDPQLAIEFIPSIRRKFYGYTTYSGEISISNPLFKLDPALAVEFGRSLNMSAKEGLLSEAESYFWSLSDHFRDADPSVFIELKEHIPAPHPLPHISYYVLKHAPDKRRLTLVEFESLYEDLLPHDREKVDEFPRSRFIGYHDN